MKKTISLSEVLSEMKKMEDSKIPVPFSISVRTYNSQNKMGGKLLHYSNVVLLQPPKIKGAKRLAMKTPFRNPNHWKNRTRNIKTSEGDKKTIHILFITKFNGLDVVL